QQREEPEQRRAEGACPAVREAEPVRLPVDAGSPSDSDHSVSNEEERRPEGGGPHPPVIVDVAGARSLLPPQFALFVEHLCAERRVRSTVFVLEMEVAV